jgi:hypothetical protein
MAAFKAIDENHPSLEMPDIETEHAAGFVIGLLQEAGLMSSNGMGPVPLSWGDIESWLTCAEYQLPLWTKLKIKQLSEDYVYELVQANEDPNRPAPYQKAKEVDEEELVQERVKVQDQILSFVRRFKRQEPEEELKDEE